MAPSQQPLGPLPVVTAFAFATESTVQRSEAEQQRAEEFGMQVGRSGVVGQESLQAKVETADATQVGLLGQFDLLDHTETQPQSSDPVPLDGHGLDRAQQRTMLHELIDPSANLDD